MQIFLSLEGRGLNFNITKNCLNYFKAYLKNINGTIEVGKPYVYIYPSKLGNKDPSLMEIAQTLNLVIIQMRRLNQVRIYLGIMWLSKICTIDRKKIRSHTSKHQKNEQEYKPTLSRSYQPKPNTLSWRNLDRVICSLTHDDDITLLELIQLGDWTKNHSNIDMR